MLYFLHTQPSEYVLFCTYSIFYTLLCEVLVRLQIAFLADTKKVDRPKYRCKFYQKAFGGFFLFVALAGVFQNLFFCVVPYLVVVCEIAILSKVFYKISPKEGFQGFRFGEKRHHLYFHVFVAFCWIFFVDLWLVDCFQVGILPGLSTVGRTPIKVARETTLEHTLRLWRDNIIVTAGQVGFCGTTYGLYHYETVIQNAKSFGTSAQAKAFDLVGGIHSKATSLQLSWHKAGSINGLYINTSDSFLNSTPFVYIQPTPNPLAVERFMQQHNQQLFLEKIQKTQALHKSIFSIIDGIQDPTVIVADALLNQVIFELCVEMATVELAIGLT